MRYSRVLMVLTVLIAALAGVGLVAAHSVPHAVRASVVSPPSRLQRALGQEVQQLTRHPPSVQAPKLSVPQSGGPCFVASGSCSLTPCVIPVQSTSNLALGAGRACPLGDRVPMVLRVAGR